MAIKVLVTAIGQQIVADVKQIENKETNEIVGYWLTQPRIVQYTQDEEENIGVNFVSYCLVSNETEFSIRADHIVSILDPRESVVEGYTKLVYPEPEVEDGTDTDTPEATGADFSVADGTTGGTGTDVPPEVTDASVGQDEAVAAEVA